MKQTCRPAMQTLSRRLREEIRTLGSTCRENIVPTIQFNLSFDPLGSVSQVSCVILSPGRDAFRYTLEQLE